jgi:hypothetical protein
VPDNYSGDFLSHHVEPIEQVLGLGIEIQLEVTDGVAPIGEKRDLLIQLMALGLEHLKEPALRFLVIRLDEGKTLAGDRRRGLFAPVKGEEALARNHLE